MYPKENAFKIAVDYQPDNLRNKIFVVINHTILTKLVFDSYKAAELIFAHISNNRHF